MIHFINNILYPLGIKIDVLPQLSGNKPQPLSLDAITLKTYLTEDGNFDYERYRKIQEEGNKRKLHGCWVLEGNIRFLSDYLKQRLGSGPLNGICHGTRRGLEQSWFRKYLKADVFGTEISETATQFPHTIQWDFHEVKPEWLGHFDFIYSNSYDHSFDPEKCIKAWMSSLKPNGICILEHSDAHSPTGASDLDPFGAHLVQMPGLIAKWGEGKFAVTDIIEAPYRRPNVRSLSFIIIEHI